MATVKDKRNSQKKKTERQPVYPRVGSPEVPWQGKIERLSWGGLGVGREQDGRIILLSAPLALFPGEEVEAKIHWKARHGEGVVTRWLTKDRRRGEAGCPVAGSCGGCDLREAGDSIGELKRLMVEDLFARQLGGMTQWRWLPAPVWARRHRIQLHWDGKELGYHQRRSHRLVSVNHCPAAVDTLSEAIPRMREALEARILPTRSQRWELATGTPPGTVVAVSEDGRTWSLEPDGWKAWEGGILHEHGSLRLHHSPGGFYQVCASWAAEAFGDVFRNWNLEGETLFDLYGGVGFFSVLLGRHFQRRVLVECDGPAVGWAKRNLEDMELPSECIAQDAAAWVPEQLGQADDLILLDPPRTGLPPELCARLQSACASRLVLVGCDGAAFCRDIKRLAPAWRLGSLAAIDLFPFTHHAECVALLEPVRP
jgi:tRNA/tmRNA/rRNA uracil-C5-methylase (TrmA/RlmC/RlmD family)